MIVSQHGLKGEFQLTILRADRSVKWRSAFMPNLITDICLDRIGAAAGIGSFCRIGTGTTAPAFTDTALQSQSASTSNVINQSTVNAGAPNYETTHTAVFEFALGTVVGNMAEVGIGWSASTASTLATRARILDGGGSPTTITVLVTEILQVTYRLTGYPALTDATGTVTISGTVYNYTARLYSAASVSGVSMFGAMVSVVANGPQGFTGALGSITSGGPAGTSANLTTGALQAYTAGTYYRDYTISAAIAVGNLAGGIKSIICGVAGSGGATFVRTQIEFSPNIPKTSTNVLNMTLRQAWARH